MKAFLSVVVLLLASAVANAFTPGPTTIRECPKCHVPIEQAIMASGNTFGARYWSDGKMGAPMLPDYPWLVKCPQCKHLFWIDEAKILSDDIKDWESRGKVTSFKFEIPTVSDFYNIVEKIKDIPKQKYIRTYLWHSANDPYREEIPDRKYNLSPQDKANMNALSKLLDEKDPEERLLKAEIARELGLFDQCLKLLSTPFNKQLTNPVDAIKMLAQEKYTPVLEFTTPGYLQTRPKTMSAAPTDVEGQLFIRALKESCSCVANGLIARYGVDALLCGDSKKLKEAITAGAAKGDDNAVAVVLNTAVLDGSIETVRFLLDNGAQVNSSSSYPLMSPLLTACLHGKENIANLLVDRGADVNAEAEFGLTPLEAVCRKRYVSLAKVLLDKGAKVDGEKRSSNPLMTLCTYTFDWPSGKEGIDWAKKTLEMVKLLISYGAKVDGNYPIIGTDDYKYRSTPLIEVCSIDLTGNDFIPVQYTEEEKAACEAIYLDIICLLLDNKADKNKTDYNGSTPLARACEFSNIEAVKLLLDRGVKVNKADNNGVTPLSIANELTDRSIAELLVKQGAKTGNNK